MIIQAEQDRVKQLLTDALPMLCRSGLSFSSQFCIEALIGITLDTNDVFLVSIKETVKTEHDSLQQKSVAVNVTKVPPGGASVRKRRNRKRPKSKGSISSDSDTDVYQNDSDEPSEMKREKLTTNESGDDTHLGDTDLLVYCDVVKQDEESTEVPLIKQELDFVDVNPGFDASSHSQDDSLTNTSPSDQVSLGPSYIQPVQLVSVEKKAKTPGAKRPGKHLCDLCGRKYADGSDLRRHVNAIHRNILLSCGECGKSFKYAKSLSQHKIAHHSNTMFQCGLCSKRYSYRKTLNKHIRSEHGLGLPDPKSGQ